MGACCSSGNGSNHAPKEPVSIEPFKKDIATVDKDLSNDTIGSLKTTLKELKDYYVTGKEGLYLHFTSKDGITGITERGPRVSHEGQSAGGFYACRYEEAKDVDELLGDSTKFDSLALRKIKIALFGEVNAEKRKMESVEYIAVVSLPTKVMDEVEIDDKDDRSQGVKIYHLSVYTATKLLNLEPDPNDNFMYIPSSIANVLKVYRIFDRATVADVASTAEEPALPGQKSGGDLVKAQGAGWGLSNGGVVGNNNHNGNAGEGVVAGGSGVASSGEVAVSDGDQKRLESLALLQECGLIKGSKVDGLDAGGRTGLMLAAMGGEADVVRHFLFAGCDPLIQHSETGSTALHLAASRGHVNVVEKLLPRVKGKTTDEGWRDFDGWNFLHLAVRKGQSKVVDKAAGLLRKVSGSDVLEKLLFARDAEERTCLHCAVAEGSEETSLECVDALCEAYGSKFKDALLTKDALKQTPLDIAKDMGRSQAYMKKLKPR